MYRSNAKLAVLVLGPVLLVPGVASAQSVSGFMRLIAQCGGDETFSPQLGQSVSRSEHGVCPALGQPGGIASINDASGRIEVQAGLMHGEVLAQSDFRGTQSDSGTASGNVSSLRLDANDLVLTDIANPTRSDPITFSMNIVFRAHLQTTGNSNCSATRPRAMADFSASAGFANVFGSFEVTAGAETPHNAMLGYANDGTAAPRTSAEVGATLGRALAVILTVNANTDVIYCDFPPEAFGAAESMIEVSFPVGTPVFNLPPGITANSAQLGIVNNIWNGPPAPPCRPDVNHDGVVNSQDFFNFLTTFFAQDPAADFNRDGSVNSQDFFDFLGRVLRGMLTSGLGLGTGALRFVRAEKYAGGNDLELLCISGDAR